MSQYWAPSGLQTAGTQSAPPTQMLFSQAQPGFAQAPHSCVAPQPSPIIPQYWPPSGVQEAGTQPVGPPSGGTMIVPEPPVLPLVPALPLAEPALPLPGRRLVPPLGSLLQLAARPRPKHHVPSVARWRHNEERRSIGHLLGEIQMPALSVIPYRAPKETANLAAF
jgi:hypothetical protein